ncbi:MAG: hypothetical protein HY438_02235 [DPANN group archaeon]|nr:hypothetical protein [DPANN group archaeon]
MIANPTEATGQNKSQRTVEQYFDIIADRFGIELDEISPGQTVASLFNMPVSLVYRAAEMSIGQEHQPADAPAVLKKFEPVAQTAMEFQKQNELIDSLEKRLSQPFSYEARRAWFFEDHVIVRDITGKVIGKYVAGLDTYGTVVVLDAATSRYVTLPCAASANAVISAYKTMRAPYIIGKPQLDSTTILTMKKPKNAYDPKTGVVTYVLQDGSGFVRYMLGPSGEIEVIATHSVPVMPSEKELHEFYLVEQKKVMPVISAHPKSEGSATTPQQPQAPPLSATQVTPVIPTAPVTPVAPQAQPQMTLAARVDELVKARISLQNELTATREELKAQKATVMDASAASTGASTALKYTYHRGFTGLFPSTEVRCDGRTIVGMAYKGQFWDTSTGKPAELPAEVAAEAIRFYDAKGKPEGLTSKLQDAEPKPSPSPMFNYEAKHAWFGGFDYVVVRDSDGKVVGKYAPGWNSSGKLNAVLKPAIFDFITLKYVVLPSGVSAQSIMSAAYKQTMQMITPPTPALISTQPPRASPSPITS